MRAYSVDLRERVLSDCSGGMEVRQTAVKYRVRRWWTAASPVTVCTAWRSSSSLNRAGRPHSLPRRRPGTKASSWSIVVATFSQTGGLEPWK